MEFLAETRWDWITEKKMEPFTLQGEANKFFSGSLHFFWVMLRYYCIPHHPLILYSFFLCLNTLYEVTVNSSEILACPNCHFLIFSSSSSSPFHSYLINNLAVGSISLSPQNSEGTIPLLLRSSVVNEMCVCFVISLVSPKALRIFYFFFPLSSEISPGFCLFLNQLIEHYFFYYIPSLINCYSFLGLLDGFSGFILCVSSLFSHMSYFVHLVLLWQISLTSPYGSSAQALTLFFQFSPWLFNCIGYIFHFQEFFLVTQLDFLHSNLLFFFFHDVKICPVFFFFFLL